MGYNQSRWRTIYILIVDQKNSFIYIGRFIMYSDPFLYLQTLQPSPIDVFKEVTYIAIEY